MRRDLGITPTSCLGIDWLHCLSLGVFQDYLAAVANKLIFKDNIFLIDGRPADLLPLSADRIEKLLFDWYKAESRRGVHHNRVQNFDYKLLGSQNKPKCSFHGAETNGLLDLFVQLLRVPAC